MSSTRVFFLFFFIPSVLTDSIGPSEKDMDMVREEDESVTLECAYDVSSSYNIAAVKIPNREP